VAGSTATSTSAAMPKSARPVPSAKPPAPVADDYRQHPTISGTQAAAVAPETTQLSLEHQPVSMTQPARLVTLSRPLPSNP
jgi:hypothetical protein